MYRDDPKQTEFLDFYMPFGGKLSTGNRWVKLAAMIPWGDIEEAYKNSLNGTGMGAPAKSGRIAFGALVIKERLGITDEETVEQILEDPYLQYFLGLHEFREKALFLHPNNSFSDGVAAGWTTAGGTVVGTQDFNDTQSPQPTDGEQHGVVSFLGRTLSQLTPHTITARFTCQTICEDLCCKGSCTLLMCLL